MDTAAELQSKLIAEFPDTPIATQASFDVLIVYHYDIPEKTIESYNGRYKGYSLRFVQAVTLVEEAP